MAYDDPRLIEEAKKKAGGPLGHALADFPLRFAAPAFFAKVPVMGQQPQANNGTMTLLRFGERQFGATCFHVLNSYRQQLTEDPDRIFQIGNAKIRPLDRLIDESKELDLAILDLAGVDITKIAIDKEVSFFEPARWPSKPISPGEFVALAGFPGVWRTHPAHLEVGFASFNLGATRVTDVGHQTIVCQLEREYWIQSIGPLLAAELTEFGGLSGCPVFNLSGLAADLVGFVYGCSPDADYLLIRPSRFVNVDGSINRD